MPILSQSILQYLPKTAKNSVLFFVTFLVLPWQRFHHFETFVSHNPCIKALSQPFRSVLWRISNFEFVFDHLIITGQTFFSWCLGLRSTLGCHSKTPSQSPHHWDLPRAFADFPGGQSCGGVLVKSQITSTIIAGWWLGHPSEKNVPNHQPDNSYNIKRSNITLNNMKEPTCVGNIKLALDRPCGKVSFKLSAGEGYDLLMLRRQMAIHIPQMPWIAMIQRRSTTANPGFILLVDKGVLSLW